MTERRIDADACVLCGACRAVCPVFQQTKNEVDVARGRIARVKHAAQMSRYTAHDKEALSLCLLCGRCTEVCKAQLDVPAIMQQARRESGYAGGLVELVVDRILTDPNRLGQTAKRMTKLAQWLRRLPDDSGLRRRLAPDYLAAGRLAPNPPARSYLEETMGRTAAGAHRVALFTGCGVGWLLPEIGPAVDRLLARLDLVAAVPEQACCGLPAWGIGADGAVEKTAAAFSRSFGADDFEVVLSPCASCTAHLQRTHGDASSVEDFFVWLANQDLSFDLAGKRLAVHVPCHARRGVRGGDAVTPLLVRAGATIVTLPAELDEQCCGMGGTFGARHTDLSRQIGLPKIRAMLAAEPDAILTHCTGCLLQLRDLVHCAGSNVPVIHPAVLLAG